MRHNLPVIDQAYEVPQGVSIVSKTDLRGIITFANQTFIEVSGFSAQELIGQPHNLVRHPDMPSAAFKQLWDCVKSGNPWTGTVKNRRSDGRYYWVRAVVVPIRRNNVTVGYMSVREAASPSEIEAAQALYRDLQNKQAGKLKIHWHHLMQTLSIRKGFVLGSVFVSMLMLIGGILGISGLQHSSTAISNLHQYRIEPLAQLHIIDNKLHQLRASLIQTQLEHLQTLTPSQPLVLRDFPPELYSPALQAASASLEQLRPGRPGSDIEQARIALINEFAQLRKLLETASQAQTGAAKSDSSIEAAGLLQQFALVRKHVESYSRAIVATAAQDQLELKQRNQNITLIALFGIAFGLTIVVLVGRMFVRDIVEPLDRAIIGLDRIAQGDLSEVVQLEGNGETGQLLKTKAAMQLHLKVMTEQIVFCGAQVRHQSAALSRRLFDISDHGELQYDRLIDARHLLSAHYLQHAVEQMQLLQEQLSRPHWSAELEAGSANVGELSERILKAQDLISLQSLTLDEFNKKIEEIIDLVAQNRADLQQCYSLSEQLKDIAQQLYDLVSFYQLHQAQVSSSGSSQHDSTQFGPNSSAHI